MAIEYRWIIKADEIPGIPCRADTTPPVKDDRTYRNFIESSFQNGYIDANELSSILFPESEQSGRKQIFISHPHSCYEAARRVKDLLSKEYYCFVDVDVDHSLTMSKVILNHIKKQVVIFVAQNNVCCS